MSNPAPNESHGAGAHDNEAFAFSDFSSPLQYVLEMLQLQLSGSWACSP